MKYISFPLFLLVLMVCLGNIFSQEPSSGPLDLGVLPKTDTMNSDNASPTSNPQKSVADSVSNKDQSVPASGQTVSSKTETKEEKEIPASTSPKKARPVLWDLIKAGGWIGVVLLILSLIACTLVIEFCILLRRSVLFPIAFVEEIRRQVELGKVRQAYTLCENNSSLLAQVLRKGLAEYQGEWPPVEKVLEDSINEETASLYRRSDYLSMIGNIAPMLGLLGTVIGMVLAFGDLAASDGLGRNLAQGIYFALITTVDGLLVAIPSLVAYSLINNRIAQMIAELTAEIDRIFRPLKHPGSRSTPPPLPKK